MPSYKPVKPFKAPEKKDPNLIKVGNTTITKPGTSAAPVADTGARTVVGNGTKFNYNIPVTATPAYNNAPPAGKINSESGAIPPAPVPFNSSMIPGLDAGRAAGKEMYGETGLDRAAFKPAFEQMRSLYQDRLNGYNSQQLAAQRAEQSQMINAQMLAAQRQNRAGMAAQGVRGAAALAGNQNIADQAINARAQMENALLAKQFEAQGGALANYNQFVDNERATAIGSEMGMGSLYQTGAQQQISNDRLAEYIKILNDYVNRGGSGSSGSGGYKMPSGNPLDVGRRTDTGNVLFDTQTLPPRIVENYIPGQGNLGYVTQPTNTVGNYVKQFGW
jgi:hypothetical protein